MEETKALLEPQASSSPAFLRNYFTKKAKAQSKKEQEKQEGWIEGGRPAARWYNSFIFAFWATPIPCTSRFKPKPVKSLQSVRQTWEQLPSVQQIRLIL